ncbi:RagB/SusD family nutrient uptake outer membrane protein [Bacteroides sp. 214]|uniref:RagB/SusD family nutrient uptake outer membrane protein n=1 Tax=Bacteroides sp. 214 TaxID=2302935 RepID=UPI0013D860E1|nr:RagB/SusD family nutrient uptake outer membrane protein [Bacteroides sp. 214]NDW13277.1 RagB/SusD family nutrient uptake outer membrane protein [Bacteroides sp. 214]
MNKIYIKSFIPAALMVLIVGMTSCVNELNIKPIDPTVDLEFSQSEVFAKIYATMGLTGQEGPAGNGDVAGIDEGTSAFYRLIFTANEYPTDEVICGWNDPGIPELYQMNWGSSHGQLEGLYGRLNYDVTLCNHFLEKTEGMEDEATTRQRAEVRFIRALNLYYLMDLFGNIPFSEVVSTDPPQQIKRADLFNYLETELGAIVDDMYDARQAPFGRADKVAAWFLLSRIYLNAEVYTGTARWTDAADYAKKVIGSSYELCPDYAQLFMADNDKNSKAMQEIILPIRQDGDKIRSYGGSLFVIAATHTEGMTPWGTSEGWGGVRARRALINKFFPNGNAPMDATEAEMVVAASDDRALFYAGEDRTLDITKPGTFKEGLSIAKWTNVRSDGGATSHTQWTDTDVPFFRLGEAYLTYAEALLRSGGSATEALEAVNTLRDRANANRLAILTLENLLDERSRELYAEGNRRTDLVRYGYFTSSSYLWDWKGGVAAGTGVNTNYNLYPIPVSDLVVNSNLVQNPGY